MWERSKQIARKVHICINKYVLCSYWQGTFHYVSWESNLRIKQSEPPSISGTHMETETKWPPVSRRHLQIHLLELIYFHWHVFPRVHSTNQPRLVEIMAWRRIGHNPILNQSKASQIWVTRSQWVDINFFKWRYQNTTNPQFLMSYLLVYCIP